LILLLSVTSFCGCTGDEDDDDDNGNGGEGESEAESESESEGEGFKLYEDSFDWFDANVDSKPLTGLDAITLAVNNLDMVAPGGTYILSSSTDLDGTGADITIGKAVAWQMHFHKTEGEEVMNRIVNIAEKGSMIVKDWYQSSDIDAWDYSSAKIDTDELPGILETHQDTTDWLSNHDDATLDIQTSSGPFGGPKELSWIMWYKSGSDSHQVYISAIDGEILA
jgi:hypothetical protein